MALDPTCLQDGACVIMSQNTFYFVIGNFVFSGIMIVLMIAVSAFSPGFVFLGAKLGKKKVVGMINRSQGLQFSSGKTKSEGIIDVRGVGPVMMTENSHMVEAKSGLQMFFCFGEFAATLPPKWVYTINKLKKRFAKKEDKELKNVSDLGELIGMKFDMVNKAWINIKDKEREARDKI